MAISTNLLGKIQRQKQARNRVKGMIEDLRESQSYLYVVPGVKEQLAAGVDENEMKEPGLWILWFITDRKGERHREEMLFCRTKEEYPHGH